GEAPTVEVALEIEEERFERRRAVLRDRGVAPQARHSLESASCCTETFYRKDPSERGRRARQPHVRGGETHVPSPLGAMHHASADRIGSPQQARGMAELAGGQRLADRRA